MKSSSIWNSYKYGLILPGAVSALATGGPTCSGDYGRFETVSVKSL